MKWHKATETPKDGEKCILRVILDKGKNEIRMGTALVFAKTHYWYDENEDYETWYIDRVKCWCPINEIECELDEGKSYAVSSKDTLRS